jgi:hypothetical protein
MLIVVIFSFASSRSILRSSGESLAKPDAAQIKPMMALFVG